ncbi:MAG: universal stress protein [Armatimonadetes bacterium]|nr:universal stress protein [Armatimonadota bacterium]
MKAIVGVGYMKQCLAGVDIFARLRFPKSEAVLVHAVEPVLPDGGFMPTAAINPITEIQTQRQRDGENRMAEVAAELQKLGIPSRSVTRFGNPAHEITEVAREETADLIISGSSKKGKLESFFMGSVTRALVVDAQRSFLVGKRGVDGDKIDAVFATDHSEYSQKCLAKLIELAPGRFGKITVVSANTVDANLHDLLQLASQESNETISMNDFMLEKNDEVCEKLQPICDEVSSVVLRGHVNDVINSVMEDARADLLILGAHGHGFIKRLLVGSTSMHMVGSEPWNVLVIRV